MRFFYSYLRGSILKQILCLFLLFSFPYVLLAQDKDQASLLGTVIDQQQHPLEGAAVGLLRSADSSIVKFEVAGPNGQFIFKNLQAGSYFIQISSLGYQQVLCGPFSVTAGSRKLDAGMLLVTPAPKNLREVSIVGPKNYIEAKPGKVILNVASSVLSAGNSAYDILKTAPGVQMDAEENIRLNGKSNVLIVINGKQTFLERENLVDLLKSTSGNEIGEIELISNPSAKFDAAGSGAVINIKLKKNKNFGTNGNVNAMAGISTMGGDSDANSRGNAGLLLNYRNRKINLFGTYSFADISQSRNILLNRNIANPNLTAIHVDYSGITRRLASTYRAGMDVNVNENHVLGIMFSGSDSKIRIEKQNNSAIFNQMVLDSTIRTASDQTRGLVNSVFNFNYKGQLGKKAGQLSFDWDFIQYRRNSDELLHNDFFDAGNSPYRESLLLRNTSPSEYDIQSVKIDYALPLDKISKLEIGLQGSRVTGDSQLDFGRIISSNFYPDARFVNHFLIEEKIGAGYINYAADFKKSSFSLGLRAENTVSKGQSLTSGEKNDRSYLNLFPNVQYSYTVNKNHHLLLSYSRRISRPGYDNLNPFVAYLDQYSFRSGNPLLRPEFSQLAEISHVYKNKFTATLRTKVTNDLILEINEQDDATQINNVVSRNLDRQYLYGLELNVPLTLASWWHADMNFQSVYEKYTSTTAGSTFRNSSPSFIFSGLQSFTINGSFTGELNVKYESPTVFGIYNYEAAYAVDAALAKSFFEKKATLRLRITDLFNTYENRFTSTYRNLDLTSTENRDSMLGQLSFSYLFGRRTVKGARKRNTGSETEQGRIGN